MKGLPLTSRKISFFLDDVALQNQNVRHRSAVHAQILDTLPKKAITGKRWPFKYTVN